MEQWSPAGRTLQSLEPATVTTFSWIFVGTGPTILAVGELGVHHQKMNGLILKIIIWGGFWSAILGNRKYHHRYKEFVDRYKHILQAALRTKTKLGPSVTRYATR